MGREWSPLILRYFDRLPEYRPGDDDDLWLAGLQASVLDFRNSIANNYTEATLQRLLANSDDRVRQAACLALGLLGTRDSASLVASRLQDESRMVRRFAHDALWEIWFRESGEEPCRKLRLALQLEDFAQGLAALDDIVREYPSYAEAINQRAILYYRRGEFSRSAADCEQVLKLNPFHFAAASGMGQCYLRLKKPKAALRAFQTALTINPDLETVREAVDALMAAFGED
jgi:tetratricopeptide (TPR) repeat protein